MILTTEQERELARVTAVGQALAAAKRSARVATIHAKAAALAAIDADVPISRVATAVGVPRSLVYYWQEKGSDDDPTTETKEVTTMTHAQIIANEIAAKARQVAEAEIPDLDASEAAQSIDADLMEQHPHDAYFDYLREQGRRQIQTAVERAREARKQYNTGTADHNLLRGE